MNFCRFINRTMLKYGVFEKPKEEVNVFVGIMFLVYIPIFKIIDFFKRSLSKILAPINDDLYYKLDNLADWLETFGLLCFWVCVFYALAAFFVTTELLFFLGIYLFYMATILMLVYALDYHGFHEESDKIINVFVFLPFKKLENIKDYIGEKTTSRCDLNEQDRTS